MVLICEQSHEFTSIKMEIVSIKVRIQSICAMNFKKIIAQLEFNASVLVVSVM